MNEIGEIGTSNASSVATGGRSRPKYRVQLTDGTLLGQYDADRPAIAAQKAFTVLRKKDTNLEETVVVVYSEKRKKPRTFNVRYTLVDDVFLGPLKRPVASLIVE